MCCVEDDIAEKQIIGIIPPLPPLPLPSSRDREQFHRVLALRLSSHPAESPHSATHVGQRHGCPLYSCCAVGLNDSIRQNSITGMERLCLFGSGV